MRCPVCESVNLVMSERSGIEIDYCTQCRGVWLDRGELDKIIDRAATAMTSQSPVPQSPNVHQHTQESHSSRHQDGQHYKKKKREGFFSDLFDFD